MRYEELLKRESADIVSAIEEITEKAGTSDASWSVLRAAAEIVVKERNKHNQ